MRHGSLFTGIGGFDLAARWMGWQNIFQVEIDKWCQSKLEKNFPETDKYFDIKSFNGEKYKNRVDIISGGFPCQPFSNAGKKLGKADDRYLWHEMLRVVGEVKPKFVLGENVTGIVGMVLKEVRSDLESIGYKVESFNIPACAKDANHQRKRIWIFAHADGNGCANRQENDFASIFEQKQYAANENEKRSGNKYRISRTTSLSADTSGDRLQARVHAAEYTKKQNGFSNDYAPYLSGYWEVEPGVCRMVDGIPDRVDRLKALGNAIVPQVAYEIFSAIEKTFM